VVLEVTILTISQADSGAFERNLAAALSILRRAEGCVDAAALRSQENPSRYLLTVRWRALDDHLVGFRQGPEFTPFRELLAPFYAQPPVLEHFIDVIED
jgi:quinol monooxygenase YgiN